jgi:hypothetical protein
MRDRTRETMLDPRCSSKQATSSPPLRRPVKFSDTRCGKPNNRSAGKSLGSSETQIPHKQMRKSTE